MTLNKIYLMNVNMMLNIKEEWNRKSQRPFETNLTSWLAFARFKERARLITVKGKFDDTLWKDFKREQVEQKYGGDVMNITQFWPP
jgi:hypothetical protein